jgi:RsmE family RNA methyltransferase
LNLILLTEDDHIEGNRYVVSGHQRQHIQHILRCKEGDTLQVGLINGPKGTATIETTKGKELLLDCTFDEQIVIDLPVVDLICALPRPQTVKKILENAATMAVKHIYFINAARVQKCYFSASGLDIESMQATMLKGLSQGKETKMPTVTIHDQWRFFFNREFPKLEAKQQTPAVKLLADLETENYLKAETVKNAKRVVLAIGPEGGWVDYELELIQKTGFIPFKMGNWPLRVENATVAAIAQLKAAHSQ